MTEIHDYLNKIIKGFKSGISTEHSYRGDLKDLVSNLVKGVTVTNEPKRQKCGAPDYIIQIKDVPIGYIEAKDVGLDLSKVEKSEQIKRYLASLDNLIITDYLNFHFYKNGQKVKEIKLVTQEKEMIKVNLENFDSFRTHINDFCLYKGQTIKSSEKLAKMMAQKARMMEEVIFNAVKEDNENNTLKDQLKAFRDILIHDLDEKTFADIYSQTIAYGLFAARLHDKTLDTFSREEALFLIPKSNPFLRQLFSYVAGPELDDRVVWIVNDLADIFKATDVKELLKDFGTATGQNDPFIHFYETFLGEYDASLRKSRGVYYTPEPVVNFIVRAVDDILKDEFNIPQGLADTTKIKIKRVVEGTAVAKGKNKGADVYEEVEVHKVQILDPATGTGTFLAEVVKHIYKRFKGQEGVWANYIEEHLIPRLNGFEILMASYTMCHLKLEMLLTETGYKPKDENKQARLRVFLTNSLEEAHPDTGTLFASWLSKEANAANNVKRDTPVMVVLGNPPYSGESANKGEWIMNLMEDYKKEPGGIEKLDERNPKWINDDYMKFLRYGQYFIEKNGEGVLAFINPHGFLDNPTFRGVRWNLLKTYDKIYILDLHGNAKKKEISPDGSKDENVFDIMQGVSINLFVKTGNKKNELAQVLHYNLYGYRELKYNFLFSNSIKSTKYNKIENLEPNYFFVMKNFNELKEYNNGISIGSVFLINSLGIQTHRDSFAISFDKDTIKKRIISFYDCKLSKNDLIAEYNLKETNDWNIDKNRNGKFNENNIIKIDYRFFDSRFIYYNKDIVDRDRKNIMKHLLKENISLTTSKQQSSSDFRHIFLSKNIQESCLISLQTKEGGYSFPLYLYPEEGSLDNERTPNLNMEIVNLIAGNIGLKFSTEKTGDKNTFTPIDILDYIYAVLHSPNYREKYKEFLKIDFPRVPYPDNADIFWKLVKLGGEIRTIHLLENPVVNNYITTFPVNGDNKVVKLNYENGKVWINKEQYFDNVPTVAWEFYIGGYQPAQKWLKDRKERALSFDDIVHYQKIVVALSETDRLMKEVDKVMGELI